MNPDYGADILTIDVSDIIKKRTEFIDTINQLGWRIALAQKLNQTERNIIMGHTRTSGIFEAAVLLHPTEKEVEDDGAKTILIQPVKSYLAETQQAVLLQVAKSIPDSYMDKADQVEILIRPFAG